MNVHHSYQVIISMWKVAITGITPQTSLYHIILHTDTFLQISLHIPLLVIKCIQAYKVINMFELTQKVTRGTISYTARFLKNILYVFELRQLLCSSHKRVRERDCIEMLIN